MTRTVDPDRKLTDKVRLICQRKVCQRNELEERRKLLDSQILMLSQDIAALRYLEKNFSPDELEIKEAYVDFLENGRKENG